MKDINEICEHVNKSAYGLSMGTIWQHISVECADDADNYLYRKDIFFYFLRGLLKCGKIKLAASGRFLTGPVDQQIGKLQAAWPPYPSNDEDDDLDEYGMWFLVKSPAGVVWLTPDGKEIWT